MAEKGDAKTDDPPPAAASTDTSASDDADDASLRQHLRDSAGLTEEQAAKMSKQDLATRAEDRRHESDVNTYLESQGYDSKTIAEMTPEQRVAAGDKEERHQDEVLADAYLEAEGVNTDGMTAEAKIAAGQEVQERHTDEQADSYLRRHGYTDEQIAALSDEDKQKALEGIAAQDQKEASGEADNRSEANTNEVLYNSGYSEQDVAKMTPEPEIRSARRAAKSPACRRNNEEHRQCAQGCRLHR